MRTSQSIIDDLHNLRSLANARDMPRTAERLRVAIIEAAYELNRPTGLSVRDLSKGFEFEADDLGVTTSLSKWLGS